MVSFKRLIITKIIDLRRNIYRADARFQIPPQPEGCGLL
jgi:ribokinase